MEQAEEQKGGEEEELKEQQNEGRWGDIKIQITPGKHK